MGRHIDCVGFGLCTWDEFLLLPYFPHDDEKIDALEMKMSAGAPVINALRFMARKGLRVMYGGSIGSDTPGLLVREQFDAEKVKYSDTLLRKGTKTPLAQIWVNNKNQHRAISTYYDKDHFKETKPDISLIQSSRALHLDNRLAQTGCEIARYARENRRLTFCDFGSLRPFSLDVLPYIDYAIISHNFLRQLDDKMDIQEGLMFLKESGSRNCSGTGTVICTLGNNGYAYITDKGQFYSRKSIEVEAAIDTTCAGDIFHGAFIYGILKEWTLETALEYANRCAAVSCTSLGVDLENLSSVAEPTVVRD